jgi:hypothetical protein
MYVNVRITPLLFLRDSNSRWPADVPCNAMFLSSSHRLFSLTERYEFPIRFDFLCAWVRVRAVVLVRPYCDVEGVLSW